MDDVVTKITNTVKNINYGKTPVTMPSIEQSSPVTSNIPSFNTPKKLPNVGKWDMMFIVKIFLIVVIVALLGFNIFAYLAKGTDIFKNFLVSYGKYIPEGIKKTLNLTEKGSALGLDIAAGTITDVKKIITKETGVQSKMWSARDKKLEQSIDAGNFKGLNNFPQHEPDQSDSTVQQKGKKGWCYVGTDRTFRSCIKVNESDNCMSGKIFPTKDICINPSLRQ
uniref:Uncharacterized protein n=1 Tax=viral metagenome TaxID=1070528 RepID=A0A6C0C3U6_9ZZZZ